MTAMDLFPFQNGTADNPGIREITPVDNLSNYFQKQSHILVWTTDSNLICTYLSGSGHSILEVTPENGISRPIDEIFPVTEDVSVIKAHQMALQGRTSHFIFTLDNRRFYQNQVEPIKDVDGNIAGLIGFGMQIIHPTFNQHESKDHTMLRTLIDNLPDPIYAKDREGRKVLANPADVASMGLKEEKEALGKTDAAFYPHELAARFIRDDEKVIRSGSPIINQIEQSISEDGKKHSFLSSKLPLKNDEGKVIGLIGISHNITKQIEAEEEVRRLNTDLELRVSQRTAELEAVNRELETFSYSVSHDLRAPLRSIISFSKALEEDFGNFLTGDARDYLDRIVRAGERMTQLIDDLLKLSRISRCEIHREMVDISTISQIIMTELQVCNPNRIVYMIIEPELYVYADTNLMRIAIENLLSNAWKFSSKHASTRIEIGKIIIDGEEVIYVRDDGAGFDMAYSSKLFSAFQRLHQPSEFEGSGIGLATVQRIINRHGGRVWAESKIEKGATVYFTIHDKSPDCD